MVEPCICKTDAREVSRVSQLKPLTKLLCLKSWEWERVSGYGLIDLIWILPKQSLNQMISVLFIRILFNMNYNMFFTQLCNIMYI